MKRPVRKILVFAGLAAVGIFAVVMWIHTRSSRAPGIIPRTRRITQEDYWNAINKARPFAGNDAEAFFREDVANKHTLDFFGFLQNRFQDMEYAEHMEAVRQYLRDTIHPPEKAEEMYELYGKYNEYQKEFYFNQSRLVKTGTPAEMLESLRDIQEARRAHFGREAADAIFGVEVKSNEYALRKQTIIGDTGLTGSEKEERLSTLRREMWGAEADTVEGKQDPRERYREKLKIYEADLSRMDDGERATLIRKLRQDLFTSEEVERMEKSDRQLAFIKARDREYSVKRHAIMDSDLSEEEKNRKIRELHNQIYGGSGTSAH